jgi:hypothetical protein
MEIQAGTLAVCSALRFRARAVGPDPHPPSGHKVLAFGYRESRINVTEGSDGIHHIVLNDIGTTSIGEVGQIFSERRDSSMLTFPCFEVRARLLRV